MTDLTQHAIGQGTIPIADIIIPSRMRKDTLEIKLKIEQVLVPSIKAHGLIHPPLLIEHNEAIEGHNIFESPITSKFSLAAGWSRITAFSFLGLESVPYNTRLNLPEHERLALELEENIARNSMTWQDIAIGIYKTHTAKLIAAAADSKSWGQSQTGFLINKSKGYVSESIIFAKRLLGEGLDEPDRELWAAVTYSQARQILTLRQEDKIAAELVKRHQANRNLDTPILVGALADPEPPKINFMPPGDDPEPEGPVDLDDIFGDDSEPAIPLHLQETTIDLTNTIFNMDCVFPQKDGSPSFFDQARPESFDLVYTDHPFAIEMDNLDLVNLDRVENEHDVEENISQFEPFLRGVWKVLKPNSYCLFWMDLKHWQLLRDIAESIGFSVQPYPVIWVKTHSCKNHAAGQHWTKAIEYVMVLRKGKASLSEPQFVNWRLESGAAERKLQSNPFAKPHAFSEWLLKPVVKPGMTVLDCYAGEGSLVRSMIRMGLKVVAVEKKVEHYNHLIEHVKLVYNEVIPGKLKFI